MQAKLKWTFIQAGMEALKTRTMPERACKQTWKHRQKQQVLSKIFVSIITLGEQTYVCQKLGTMHCCQVFKFL